LSSTIQEKVAGNEALIQTGVVAGSVLAIAAAVWTASFPEPFPLVELIACVAAMAATRRFGIQLPGKGFASFVLAVDTYAVLRHGWAFGSLVSLLGMPAGDLLFRRLRPRAAVVNAGHLTLGTALVGFAYEQLGGAIGGGALLPDNLLPLAFLVVVLPLFVNATFYLELAASAQAIAWVDARLTLRWEAVVSAMSIAIAVAWVWTMEAPSVPFRLAVGAAQLGFAVLAHWIAREGVRADELGLIQRLAGAIAADIDLERNFATIQALTRRLVPWDEMRFLRYDDLRHEMELVADTAGGTRGERLSPDEGLLGEAIRRKAPVVSTSVRGAAVAQRHAEIVVPLHQADRLVGAWTVRHGDPAMYRELDAVLLGRIAPSLALALRLNALVAPLVESSEQTAQYVEHLTATSEEIHASSQEVTASTHRAETGALRAAELVGRAEEAMTELRATAHDAAAAGEETHRSAQEVESAAQAVRAATARTAAALDRIGATVAESAAEVERLRDAADKVGQFAETIGSVASQTNMLALNATIEAARAGQHGAGFAVVADEVRRLAEQSAREAAQASRTTAETRRVIDTAAQLLERMRRELSEIAETSRGWITELEGIAKASETAARLSNRMIEFPRRNTQRAEEMQRLLQELRAAAEGSAAEAQVVAAAATQQLQAIESLSRSAIQLSQSADQLSRAARFVRE
jgi:methyl-accepting chemotaxis protein